MASEDRAEYDRGAAQEEKRTPHSLEFRTALEIARSQNLWRGESA